jgi:hypothetical protein
MLMQMMMTDEKANPVGNVPKKLAPKPLTLMTPPLVLIHPCPPSMVILM